MKSEIAQESSKKSETLSDVECIIRAIKQAVERLYGKGAMIPCRD